MASLNLEDDNVLVHEISLDEARELAGGGEISVDLMSAFDEAQEFVHMGKFTIVNLVIRIKGE